jgi:hypothetical protein
MIIKGLAVPPFNTTLLGVVRGVANYYGLTVTDAMLFGGTGHAFLSNVNEELCPSGPYCWNRAPFYALLRNMGIEMIDEGFFSTDNSPAERARIETVLKDHLNEGGPCGLVNMEYQLILGYDDSGFVTSQPWPGMDFPPKHLAFGSWAEFGQEVHVNFFTFNKVRAKSERDIILGGLRYALDLYENPAVHTAPPRHTGAEAYEVWIAAVEKGHGGSHGNWWNATVWGESRRTAGRFFAEIQGKYPELAERAGWLSEQYVAIADRLGRVSDRAGDKEEKMRALREIVSIEKECISGIRELAASFQDGG